MNPVQRRVADIWRKILRVNRVSLHDNFFDIGGHSMLIVKLHGELKREFDSDLALIELFQQTTVALQAERVSSAVVSEAALHRAQARAKKRLHVQ
jgi:acyl carrier protein